MTEIILVGLTLLVAMLYGIRAGTFALIQHSRKRNCFGGIPIATTFWVKVVFGVLVFSGVYIAISILYIIGHGILLAL